MADGRRLCRRAGTQPDLTLSTRCVCPSEGVRVPLLDRSCLCGSEMRSVWLTRHSLTLRHFLKLW